MQRCKIQDQNWPSVIHNRPFCRETVAVMSFEKRPEYRALEQIVAEALAEGRQVFVLGASGIVEILPNVGQKKI